LHLLTLPAIPLELSLQVSPSGWAGGDFPILIGFSFHQPFRRPTPDALQGSSVEVTVRPLNLWMQVQKLSKFVDFTKACAESGLSKDLSGYWCAFAQESRQKDSGAGRLERDFGKVGMLQLRSGQVPGLGDYEAEGPRDRRFSVCVRRRQVCPV
jgi:hypothetical protein